MAVESWSEEGEDWIFQNTSHVTKSTSVKMKLGSFSVYDLLRIGTLGARASESQRMKNGGKKMRKRMEEERGKTFSFPRSSSFDSLRLWHPG